MSVKVNTTILKEATVAFKPKLIEDAFVSAIMGQLHREWPELEDNILQDHKYIEQAASQLRRHVSDMLEAQWNVTDDKDDIEISIKFSLND